MRLEHSFTVPVSAERAWDALTDIELVAPCMPGATLEQIDGDEFSGVVKVKLGPIALTYKGAARWVERDEVARRVVIDAQGRDSRGNGSAAAKVTAALGPDGEGTRVSIVTDLNITGKPAQFGRGVMADVGDKLVGQFASCLAEKLALQDLPRDTVARPEPAPTDAIDLPESAGPAIAKRAAPLAFVLVALLTVVIAIRRRSR